MKLLQNMSMKQRLLLGGSALAVLVVFFMLFRLASSPSYSLVATGLDPAKTGKMTAALDAQGIPYELRNNGTALAVEKAQTAQAQIALAGQGLTGGGAAQPGFELLDKQKLGASSFQQKVAYQRALEGQIAQTVGQVGGVSGATVSLTLPEDQLFASEARPATAAVLLQGDATTLQPGAVRGIASLVSHSVEGLKPENVTIADSNGQMLWPQGDGATAGAMSKPAAEARYASTLEASLNAMVARTLGPGKAQVQVNADLNVDETTTDKLEYADKGTPLRVTEDDERLRGSGAGGGGAAGATANVPGYAQAGAAGGGNSNYRKEGGSTEFAVGKTVTRTKVAPGSVNRMDVALVVDKSVPAAEVAALRSAVASAAGIQRGRGDTLAVSQMTFAKQPDAAAAGPLAAGGIMGYAKYAALGLASLVFLFFIARHLRRRENEALVEPTWLRQLDAPLPVTQLEAAGPRPLSPGSNPRRDQVEETVRRDPERVATALRGWMAEDDA